MNGVILLAVSTCGLLVLGLLESFRHKRRLARIPIRIHVNGTRGKSSVTRLIAAGLRAGGLRTVAKTTGTLPRLILPDGTEEPVFRRNSPNVIEQISVVRRAAERNATAIVIECMAVNPLLQSLCELRLIQSTHGAITNARADHLDKMGPTSRDVARALAGTVPLNGKLFTAEQVHLPIFQGAARHRRSVLVAVDPDDVASVTHDELSGFAYVEHPENVALALEVCMDLGVDREVALLGMQTATPDAGAMTALDLVECGRHIRFVNAFAANDPESTERNWSLASEQMPFADLRVAVINCRADRPERSAQLAEMCARQTELDCMLVIGTATEIFAKKAACCGVCASRINVLERAPADEVCERLLELPGSHCLVMGMGNICGVGMELVERLSLRSLMSRPVEESALLQEAA